MKNIPFRGKSMTADGRPLVPNYYNDWPNRKQRREHLHYKGGSKFPKLYVLQTGKYKVILQRVWDKTLNSFKTIRQSITYGKLSK